MAGLGRAAAFVPRQTQEPPAYTHEFTDHLIGIAAFCRADLGVRPLAVPSFPVGFEPLDALTGAAWVFEVWPEDRRLDLPETRSSQLDEDPGARILLVASPWPALALGQVLRVLWSWAERRSDGEPAHETMRARVVEAFTWTHAEASAYLAALG